MKSTPFYKNLFELNIALIFISTSGVLGRYIDLPVPLIIFIRALIGGILLFVFCKLQKIDITLKKQDKTAVLLGGLFLGIHWITYFFALKLSGVAIGMLSLFTYPVITAILEPIFIKSKFQIMHLVLGVMVLFGIYLLSPELNFESDLFKGICLGVFSAVFYSVRNILLKSKVAHYNQSSLMFNQLAIISVFLLPVLNFFDCSRVLEYLPTTLLLAVLTTAIGHTLFVYSLKNFSVASASLISSLIPIYGIILATIFLNEYPNLNTILGGLVIISTVFIESIRIKRANENMKEEVQI
jgi:drug/metabolite transporter (DMT)-like permease